MVSGLDMLLAESGIPRALSGLARERAIHLRINPQHPPVRGALPDRARQPAAGSVHPRFRVSLVKSSISFNARWRDSWETGLEDLPQDALDGMAAGAPTASFSRDPGTWRFSHEEVSSGHGGC